MIDRIRNAEQFGYWAVAFRSERLGDPDVPRMALSQTPYRDCILYPPSPFLLILGNSWLEVPLSIQGRLQEQYESARFAIPDAVHLFVSPSRVQLKVVSRDVVEKEEDSFDTIGEHHVLRPGLILDYSTGWNEFKAPAHNDRGQRMADYLLEGIHGPRRIRRIKPTEEELRNLASFIEGAKRRAVVCTDSRAQI